MTMTNAEWCIQSGYKFSDLQALDADKGKHGYRICIATRDGTYKKIGETENIYSNRLTSVILWLDEEHVEPILDDAERRYLKGVIRPFRNKIYTIVKWRSYSGDSEWLSFISESKFGAFFLPNFKAGTMYKGMEVGRKYTLEELGL